MKAACTQTLHTFRAKSQTQGPAWSWTPAAELP